MSACRSLRCSPEPETGSSSSSRTRRRSSSSSAARATSATSLPRGSRRSSSRARSRSRPTTTCCKEADAILIALQTPLTAQREPDLSIVLGAAAGHRAAPAEGPAGRARVDDVSRHDARAPRADPRERQRAQGRPGLPSRLLARARRSRPRGLDDPEHAEDRRRPHPACTERAVELYSRALETVHPVSSPEAAELTKLLENIFRSVNIALVNELAQLCDRMQIDVWEVDRRGRDEAVRVHELPAGPRARRPLHADRPLLPDLEGARIRLLHRVHRARGQGQREHAVLVPRQDRPRAERAREGRSRARRSSSSASPTRRTSTTRASRRR